MNTNDARLISGRLKLSVAALPLTVSGGLLADNAATPLYPQYPSETPDKFIPVTDSYDNILRDVMIPMRDGVKLHTVILVPQGAVHAGMLLTRTPYTAKDLTSHIQSGHLGPMLHGYDNATDVILEDGYIRVVQDIRGKYGSEGDYVMNRPIHGPQNPTPVDGVTDTYDTIDWLVKNVPESNGQVGTLGISYDGFEPLMALVNPHPALKVSVPMNPMVDGWMGDDWFHNSLSFEAPAAGDSYSEYIADPARPVPFRARPIQQTGYGPGQTWQQWLTDDQREASGRTDVLTFTSAVLTKPLKISGQPGVHLVASTSGTDSDWVVKLIDVYPDEVYAQSEMGGYQLAVGMDIFRGRYREGFVIPKPIKANQPLAYEFKLPQTNHVFLPGHRIMVQVQSSWFPLYDRNPQTYVANIFLATPGDYRKATQRVFHSATRPSYISLPVMEN